MAIEFSLQSVSKCRNLLMGYAILGVLVGHIISFGDVESFGFINAILWLSGLVHTAGFLFLSGFGVFYSLHKRECIWDFYKRRVKRFLLPFLLLALPFYVLVCYVNGYDLLQYLSYISTVEFWLHGNYHGMWYIAVSLLLYIITPPICNLFSWLKVIDIARDIILVCLALGICYCVKCYFPDYYEQECIGLKPLPMFYVGFLFGDLSQKKFGQNSIVMMGLFVIVAILYFIDIPVYGIGFILQRLFGIMLVCLVFKMLMDNQTIYLLTIFNWLGKYTFELYILHLYYWFIIKGICNYGEMFNIVTAVLLSILTCAPVHKLIEYIVSLVRRKKRLCI